MYNFNEKRYNLEKDIEIFCNIVDIRSRLNTFSKESDKDLVDILKKLIKKLDNIISNDCPFLIEYSFQHDNDYSNHTSDAL